MVALKHSFSDRGNDLYETPPEAVRALLEVEPLPQTIWEPSCGPGAIVRVLRSAGHLVYATDLIDYNSPDQDESGWDFLLERGHPGAEAIVGNPPFKLATAFVRKALELCPKAIFLMRLAFLEGSGRSDILDSGQLARVYVFKNRLPLMHRDGWKGKKSRNFIAFAWFVFERDHKGTTELRRIAWKRENQQVDSSILKLLPAVVDREPRLIP